MKRFILISLISCILFSCKKEAMEQTHYVLPSSILKQLKDSMNQDDFLKLDFAKAIISTTGKKNVGIARIPFLNLPFKNDFVIVQLERNGLFSLGKIINITGNITTVDGKNTGTYNGHVKIYSLQHHMQLSSPILNGYITVLKDNNTATSITDPYLLLPTVVVTSTLPPLDGGIRMSLSLFYNLQSLFYAADDTYSFAGDGFFNLGGSSGGTAGGDVGIDTPLTIQVDMETVENYEAIDIAKYLNCFSLIPDAGSTSKISIMTDLPVDNNSDMFFNWENGSPGHTFIQLTKTNGTQKIVQNIGFYPVQGWKTGLTTAPLNAKFGDNNTHEFNASMTMSLTAADFQTTLTHIGYLARFVKYDIDEYNCTDFALEVFNYRRANKLIIPMYDIPGGMAVNGTATPQGLYKKMKSIKEQHTAESSQVFMPNGKEYASQSQGPCN